MARITVLTPAGTAWVDLDNASNPSQLLVIGHGAGGSVEAPDILAVRRHCLAAGISVARVTQPYRVAGRKAPPAAATLDTAWQAVLANLGRRKALAGLAVSYGGRSSGARVACRSAADETVTPRPIAVLALAFPVHPPGKPEQSRLDELDGVPVPVLVVQGESDPFGVPPARRGRRIITVPGDHGLKKETDAIGRAVADWLSNQV